MGGFSHKSRLIIATLEETWEVPRRGMWWIQDEEGGREGERELGRDGERERGRGGEREGGRLQASGVD